ncbi:MAG: M20 family metallopeptidase [Roseovarius sp.]
MSWHAHTQGNTDAYSSQTADMPQLDPLKLLQDAVRCNTISSLNRDEELASMLAETLERFGIKSELRRTSAGVANLTATLRGARPGPRLVLNGHLDTVPIGEREWSYPPFSAEIVGDRLYGRGTADMKGGLVALLCAFIGAKDAIATGAGELVFAACHGEETGSHGAKRMLEDDHLPEFDAMIVAEPTSNLPLNAHKGAFWVEIAAIGRTAHSSAPSEGVNAIDAIQLFRRKLDDMPLPSDATGHLSPATMAVTRISGGKGNNVVPDTCTMTMDFRTLPCQDHGALLESLKRVAATAAQEMPGSEIEVRKLVDLPSVRTAPDADIIESVQSALDETGRGRATLGAANYFTDASVFQKAGGDIVILGPGRADQAHQTDEFIEISEFHAAIGIYAAAIRDFHTTGSKQKP